MDHPPFVSCYLLGSLIRARLLRRALLQCLGSELVGKEAVDGRQKRAPLVFVISMRQSNVSGN